MIIDTFVDTLAAERRVGHMMQKLRHFKHVDIGQELSAWQTRDMHRKRPYTMRNRRAGIARTLIRPHSRYEMRHRRRIGRQFIRKGRYLMRYSHRPILRVQLFLQLKSRLDILIAHKLTWK